MDKLKNYTYVNQIEQRYSGSTLLYSAVVSHNTNIDMINLLLENKANINLRQYNKTLLHAAISHNNLDIIKTLIKNKANILIDKKDISNSIIYSISEKK
jgi:ankyrin repeat protein